MSHQLREKWLLGKNIKNEDVGKIIRRRNRGYIILGKGGKKKDRGTGVIFAKYFVGGGG